MMRLRSFPLLFLALAAVFLGACSSAPLQKQRAMHSIETHQTAPQNAFLLSMTIRLFILLRRLCLQKKRPDRIPY